MTSLARPVILLTLVLVTATGCGDDEPSADGAATSSSQSASSSAGPGGAGGAGGSGGAGAGGASTGGSGGGGSGGASPTIDCSGDLLLHYEFHNQIVGSYLDIEVGGAVTHVEHDCCPPTDHPIDEAPLGPPVLADLQAWIEMAAAGALAVEEGLTTAEGSLSGTLQACTANGEGVVLRDVARNDGGKDVVTVNQAPAALQIRGLVEAKVTQDMY